MEDIKKKNNHMFKNDKNNHTLNWRESDLRIRWFCVVVAMLAAGRVKSFSVGLAPAVHFPTSAANTTRHKMSAKSYEITVQFANGVDTRDVMDHIGSGAARDCFKLRELPMVLKWFTETTDARYTHLHQGELDGYLRVAGQPVAQHLPAVYATRKLEVQNAKSGGTMEVDCLLTEFVGPTLYELCRDKDLSEHDVQKLFVKLLLMIEKFTAANVSWGHDFHSRNICYHKLKGVWMMVDLEGVDPPSGLISSQVNKAGQRLRKDLQTETKPAFQEFTRLILQFMVIQTAPWQWDGTSVTPVARQLGIDINSLEARRMDHEDHVFDPIFLGGGPGDRIGCARLPGLVTFHVDLCESCNAQANVSLPRPLPQSMHPEPVICSALHRSSKYYRYSETAEPASIRHQTSACKYQTSCK